MCEPEPGRVAEWWNRSGRGPVGVAMAMAMASDADAVRAELAVLPTPPCPPALLAWSPRTRGAARLRQLPGRLGGAVGVTVRPPPVPSNDPAV